MPEFQKNVLLKNYTTYKIGGPAKYFFVAKNTEDLLGALKVAKQKKLRIFIMGGGSNILVADKGFNGLVIKIDISDIEIVGNKIHAGAGVNLAKLAYLSAENGLSGLEWSAGIPGITVGGAIYGHAQAFGVKISDIVESAQAVDLKTLSIKIFSKSQCKFSLKKSIFKKNRNLIVVSANLVFQEKEKDGIKNKIKELLDYRKSRHPDFPSAGSVFVNPENEKGVISVGYLIEKLGLMGKKIGGAQISEKHGNFIVNIKDAKAKDILALIKLVKQKSEKEFGIKLETEVQFVGFKK